MKRIFTLFLVVIALVSCKKNDPKGTLDVESLELHYDEVHQFKLTQDDKVV